MVQQHENRPGQHRKPSGADGENYLAAEAITGDGGVSKKFLQPDIPASGLMKIFG